MRDAVSLIVDPSRQFIGLGAAVLGDYSRLSSDRSKVSFDRFSYLWCFSIVAYNTLRLAERHLQEGDRIEIIFDEKSDLEFKAGQMFQTVLDMLPQFAECVARPQFASSHEVPPLQAADLLAYETYKELKNRREDPPRMHSKALKRLVEDGEVVAPEGGRQDFRALLAGRGNLHYAAFDALWVNGKDLRGLPLTRRKRALGRLIWGTTTVVSQVFSVEERGRDLFAAVERLDLEGIVAKRKADPYTPATVWYKVKNRAYTQSEGRGDLFHRAR